MANIVLRLSTGNTTSTSNSDPNQSLGGNMATNAEAVITPADTRLNNLFDNISKLENANGTTDYRCVFIHNDTTTAGAVFSDGAIFLQGLTKATIELGIGAIGTTAAVIPDENTAPAGITFSAPSATSPLYLPAALNPGDAIPLWIKRTANNIAGAGTITDIISIVVRGVE